jgi:para-aminobenzoate synthetase
MSIRTLIIDNYDSFTFNLYQLIATVNGEEPLVVRNDQLTWAELEKLSFDNIVISPGPGTPEREADFGVCRQAILYAQVPVLGVCLGHQGLGLFYEGDIQHAPQPMHGRISAVYHDNSPLFAKIPQGFQVVRYHSLIVANSLPDCLQRSAWTEDQLIMGLSHRSLPRWGVQFHPESICTEYGEQLLQNFRDLTHKHSSKKTRTISVVPSAQSFHEARSLLEVHSKKLSFFPDPESAFVYLYQNETHSFWLDSSLVAQGLSRFSFMGAPGPQSMLVSYSQKELTIVEAGQTHKPQEDIYTFLARELERRRYSSPELPFDFNCGFVGYFGYELKATEKHQSLHPDALFLLADRVIAFDHQEQSAYLVCLVPDANSATAWFQETEEFLGGCQPGSGLSPQGARPPLLASLALRLGRKRETYLADIARCQQYITDGESYEICLTNQIHASPVSDPLALYLTLRRVNPAPYAAFLRFNDLCILSSSPERFLRIDQNNSVESKPIKGTRPRGKSLEHDETLRRDLSENEKDRSENLMIVDLLRNDLGQVCKTGSVHVPKLMQVESYQTVHQLVSTIRGQLRSGLSAIDCLRAAFPGGSMTGAPKLRTMKLIDEFETEARGIYSGTLGFLALSGAADLDIIIRTMVATSSEITIGVGGAIVALSNAEEEFEEALIKAKALIDALLLYTKGNTELREQIFAALRESGFVSV